MGALMRAYNWEEHPLGSPKHWPQSLKANIRLLLNSGFPMFIWWSEGLYAFHNDAYLPALGKKHPSALGTSAREIWSEIWGDIGGVAERILAGGEPFYADGLRLELARKGFREETYWTFSYSPVFDDAGKVFGVFCACFEETSTILGQRRLKTLKDIADELPRIQTLEQACQTTCDILAQNEEDIPFSQIYLLNQTETEVTLLGESGKTVPQVSSAVLLQEQETSNAWPFSEVLQSKKSLVLDDLKAFSVPLENAGGQTLPERAVILPIFRPGQDHLIGFFVSGISPKLEYDTDYQNFFDLLSGQMATSISSVKVREEATRKQNELNELFQQAPVAICILRGPDHVVELANPGILELWGKRREDVMRKPVLEALPELADQGIKELLDGVYRTGIPYVNNELPLLLERNGRLEPMYFNFVYQPMRDALGGISGVMAIAIGINEQVEARRQIEAKNRELLAINADLDNFVYSASHDLKAPISNIEGLVETLVEHLPAPVREQEIVQRVLTLMGASISRFKRAVADLTEVAKIQRAGNEDVATIDLAEVIADVRLDFEHMIKGAGARIKTQLASDSTVSFSAKNVRSIVYNLLSNALKYRSKDRPLEISISTHHVPGFTVLSVSDNGLGMKPEDRDKIFTMFKRLHDHVEGTGIGLYIVKRILENAGGHIEVESEKGEGATFRVFFKD
ncbi:PAS domain S-box protein [Rufibacter latericius]|uniref:histidine kinase n=2 Tax=Rufibacter latericius TaxID=2487040 RepID=A0A3M9MTQ4_9BACT|nr:PAS domain S-box protein [Rufibacter latericius]